MSHLASDETAEAAVTLLRPLPSWSSSSFLPLIVTALTVLFTLTLLLDRYLREPIDPLEPPLLQGLPIFGHFIGLTFNQPEVFHQIAQKAGPAPIVTVYSLGKKIYVANTPSVVQACMRNKHLGFKARIMEIAKNLGADLSLTRKLLDDGSEKLTHMTSASLHGENLKALTARALDCISDSLNQVRPGSPHHIDSLLAWSRDLIATATVRAVYGDQSPFADPELLSCIWKHDAGIGKLQYGRLSKIVAREALESSAKIKAALRRYYQDRLDQGPTVSLLVSQRAALYRSIGFKDEQIGSMDGLPAAATINSAPTMLWFIIFTFSDQSIMRRTREEIMASSAITFRPGPDGRRTGEVDTAALQNLPFLLASYRETLRYVNVVTGARAVEEPTAVTDPQTGRTWNLAGDVDVRWSASVMHRERRWADGRPRDDTFDFAPDRWLSQTPEAARAVRESFVPFGGGKHLCPGRNFAMTEILAALAVLAVGYDLRGVHRPDPVMPSSIGAICSPAYRGRPEGATLSRREGFEDVEWESH